MQFQKLILSVTTTTLLASVPAIATPFSFSTGDPDGLIAMATRPASPGLFEIETADDFIVAKPTKITGATFTGIIPAGSDINRITVEIYRVFPKDSDVNRTSGAPFFSTPQVPARVNSPSDVALDSRDSASATLTFTTHVLANQFVTGNSVTPGGVQPFPNQTTGGNGPARGQEVQFDVTFSSPFSLSANHFFFVPQVELDVGDFLWLSAPKPITGGTGPFLPDLQAWTRTEFLQPDWLRVGTDIVGGAAYNAAFSLSGRIPEPGSLPIFAAGLFGLGFLAWRQRRRQ
jgi:hypothetical protein